MLLPENPKKGKSVASLKAEVASQTEMTKSEDETDVKSVLPQDPPIKKIENKNPSDSEYDGSSEDEKPKPKQLSKKDLPHFDGKPGEDALLFMNRYEMAAKFHHFREKDRIDHLHMCFDHAAFSWLMSSLHKTKKWAELKSGFLSFFGKGKDDFVLEKLTAKKYAIKDPNMFICQVLDQLSASDPNASDMRKADALYDALPRKLKIKFLENDRPKNAEDFALKLKRMSRVIKAKSKYEETDTDSDNEDTKEQQDKHTTQMFALMTDVKTQVSKLAGDVDKIQTTQQSNRFGNRQPAQSQNTAQNRSGQTCNYCKRPGHVKAECSKLAWVEQQPWYTGRRNERDANGRIISQYAPRPNQGNQGNNAQNWQQAQPNQTGN